MSIDLVKKYEISSFEALLCSIIRFIRGTSNCPPIIYKRSYKKYGWKDNLARYWWEKYNKVEVGRYTYGYQNLGTLFIKKIGAFCSIAPHSITVPNGHNMNWVTTSSVAFLKEYGFVSQDKLSTFCPNVEHSIEIGNDVWIGAGCIIFNNVKIGDGAVIAAGSIVRKDVPPYAVIGGIDRILKYRFSDDIIDKLSKIEWWKWNDTKIKKNIDLYENPHEFIKYCDNMEN